MAEKTEKKRYYLSEKVGQEVKIVARQKIIPLTKAFIETRDRDMI